MTSSHTNHQESVYPIHSGNASKMILLPRQLLGIISFILCSMQESGYHGIFLFLHNYKGKQILGNSSKIFVVVPAIFMPFKFAGTFLICWISIASFLWPFLLTNHSFFNRMMLQFILPTLCRASKENPPNDCMLNAIIHALIRHPDDFHSAEYCSLIFDKFLFTWLPRESFLHHSLRLLWFIHAKIESSIMVALLTNTQPTAEVRLSIYSPKIYFTCPFG